MPILQEIKVPLLAVNDTSLTVVNIVFAQGAFVKKGDMVLVLETSKTTYDVFAETDGFIGYDCISGEDYEVNEIVAKIFSDESEVVKNEKINDKKIVSVNISEKAHEHWEGETLFSPAAISLIESSGISPAIFKGFDFVSREDVEAKLGLAKKSSGKSVGTAIPATLLPVDTNMVIVEKLASYKKREIEYLGVVQSSGLTSTVNTFVETEGIFVHINESLKYLKNSLLPVIIYETARLLEKYTILNAYFTGDATALYKQVDIGFAIDIDKGLKVLKIAGTASKNISEIEEDILALSDKYIDDKLEVNDLTGISFTVTDLSSEGVAFFRPLVNSMNSAILGISAIDEKLDRCILSITFDHRVTEGKTVARFLHELKERLESYQSKYHTRNSKDIHCFKCFKSLDEDLGGTGFSRCITPEGKEAYICQSCFKGF